MEQKIGRPPSKHAGISRRTLLAAMAAAPGLTGQNGSGWRSLFDGKTFDGWEDPARKSPPGDSWLMKTAASNRSLVRG